MENYQKITGVRNWREKAENRIEWHAAVRFVMGKPKGS